MSFNIRFCWCDNNRFCENGYCKSIDIWIPEYKRVIDEDLTLLPKMEDTTEYINSLLEEDYEQMNPKLMIKFMCFLNNLGLKSRWLMFIIMTLMFRNVKFGFNHNYIIDNMKNRLNDTILLLENSNNNIGKERFLKFFNCCEDVLKDRV